MQERELESEESQAGNAELIPETNVEPELRVELIVMEESLSTTEGTWRKKALKYRNIHLGTRLRFANRIMADPEIGLRVGLGLISETDGEQWEKTRKQLQKKPMNYSKLTGGNECNKENKHEAREPGPFF
jgi:hypothetical protein